MTDRPEACTCFGGYCYKRFCVNRGRAIEIDPDDLLQAADFVSAFMAACTMSERFGSIAIRCPEGRSQEEVGRQAGALIARLRRAANPEGVRT